MALTKAFCFCEQQEGHFIVVSCGKLYSGIFIQAEWKFLCIFSRLWVISMSTRLPKLWTVTEISLLMAEWKRCSERENAPEFSKMSKEDLF